jgi:thymidylate synthase
MAKKEKDSDQLNAAQQIQAHFVQVINPNLPPAATEMGTIMSITSTPAHEDTCEECDCFNDDDDEMCKEDDDYRNPPQKLFVGDNYETIYRDILRELCENPEFTPAPRGIGAREITNLSFELTNPLDRLVWNKERDTNYEFAMKFWLWMLNADTDFGYVSGSNAKAKNFIDNAPVDPKAMPANFSTAYGPRIAKQMPAIIEELRRDPDSRRCVIHVLNEGDLNMLGTQTKEEYPCTDSFTFMIRNNRLNMYTHMRSNNMVLTVVYDVFNFTMLHEWLYKKLKAGGGFPDLKLGTYYQNIVSAHYFDKEQDLVNRILGTQEPWMTQKKQPPAPVAPAVPKTQQPTSDR